MDPEYLMKANFSAKVVVLLDFKGCLTLPFSPEFLAVNSPSPPLIEVPPAYVRLAVTTISVNSHPSDPFNAGIFIDTLAVDKVVRPVPEPVIVLIDAEPSVGKLIPVPF